MLLENKKTFSINLVGGSTKSSYIGAFTVKCILTPLEYIAANKLLRSLISGENTKYIDDHTYNLAYALSQLQYKIIESPPFWKNDNGVNGGHILDDNIIIEVLTKSTNIEVEYREEMAKQAEEAVKLLQQAVKENKITKSDEELENKALAEDKEDELPEIGLDE